MREKPRIARRLKSGFELGHPRKFMLALAHGVVGWQYVEHELAMIFSILIGGRDWRVVLAAYHEITGFSARVQMIDAAARVALERDALGAELRRLLEEAKRLAAKRNALVHRTLLGSFPRDVGDPFTLVLGRSYHDTRKKADVPMGLDAIEAATAEFDALRKRLGKFASILAARLARQPRGKAAR